MTSDPAATGPDAPVDQDGGAAAGSEAGSAARVAGLEAELADCKHRLLRALADQENARRRAERERDEAVKYAPSGLSSEDYKILIPS